MTKKRGKKIRIHREREREREIQVYQNFEKKSIFSVYFLFIDTRKNYEI